MKLWTLAALAVCGLTVLTSCSDSSIDNPTTPDTSYAPADSTEYTIIFYGYGGGNLDDSILKNVVQSYKASASSYKKVNFIGQYTFSTTEELAKYVDSDYGISKSLYQNAGGQTFRFASDAETFAAYDLNNSSHTAQAIAAFFNYETYYGERYADVTNPDSLSNFISWAAHMYPARHYLLIVNDHGGGYRPHDDIPTTTTRGITYDNYNKHHFTVTSLHDAIKQSGVNFQTIYLDACLMNTIEYQFELKDLADYYVASTFVVPGEGGRYDILMDQLAQQTDVEKALANFNKGTVDYWDQQYGKDSVNYHDMTVTRTANLDAFGRQWKLFTDRLCDAYQNGGDAVKAAINECTLNAFKVDNDRAEFDLTTYATSIMSAAPAYFDESFAKQLATAFNNCIVSQQSTNYLEKNGWCVDCSILIGTQGHWVEYDWRTNDKTKAIYFNGSTIYYGDGTYDQFDAKDNKTGSSKWGSTLYDTYLQLAFDRATEWHRWILLNEQEPLSWSAASFKLDLFD